jgi:F0F1-type ATP synthase assembly protein I
LAGLRLERDLQFESRCGRDDDWRAGGFRPAGYKVTGTTQPYVRRLAFSFVLGQSAVSVDAGLLAWSIAGNQAALSALLGGGISTAGSLVMALVAFRRRIGLNALQMLTALLVGESAKFLVIVGLLVVVQTLMKVSPVPMLSAYVATFFVYWVVFAGQWRGRASALSGREMR